jgi:hypothetical protein
MWTGDPSMQRPIQLLGTLIKLRCLLIFVRYIWQQWWPSTASSSYFSQVTSSDIYPRRRFVLYSKTILSIFIEVEVMISSCCSLAFSLSSMFSMSRDFADWLSFSTRLSLTVCVIEMSLSHRLCFRNVSLSPLVFTICPSLSLLVFSICPSLSPLVFSKCLSLTTCVFEMSPLSPLVFSKCLSQSRPSSFIFHMSVAILPTIYYFPNTLETSPILFYLPAVSQHLTNSLHFPSLQISTTALFTRCFSPLVFYVENISRNSPIVFYFPNISHCLTICLFYFPNVSCQLSSKCFCNVKSLGM